MSMHLWLQLEIIIFFTFYDNLFICLIHYILKLQTELYFLDCLNFYDTL